MNNTLKIWLRKNKILRDPNCYTGEVLSAGSIDFDGIIDSIINDGTEYQRETIASIVSQYNRKCAQFAASGYNVNNGLVYLKPVVTGIFRKRSFDPSCNSIYVSASQGSEIQKAIAETDIDILGVKPESLFIGQLTNMLTGKSDGTLPRGYNARIEGRCIRIAGDSPAVGIYLLNMENQVETKLPAEDIVVNEPSRLIIHVPSSLEQGAYRLRIVSQFADAGRILKTPRECTYAHRLVVV